MTQIPLRFTAMAVALGWTVALGHGHLAAAESIRLGDTTISVGAGAATLTLPDIAFTKAYDGGALKTKDDNSDDFGDAYGWAINGAVSVPLSGTQNLVFRGFWSQIDDQDTTRCTTSFNDNVCAWVALVDDPAAGNNVVSFADGDTARYATGRDVSHWGLSMETAWPLPGGGNLAGDKAWRLAVGADIRGIDQDIAIRTSGGTPNNRYDEDLDTRYYGAFAAIEGDYAPWLFAGLWERWGLQSSFRLQGGVYHADIDYDGRISNTIASVDGGLSLSESDVAFIGGVTFETSKRIGPRATLSWQTQYEYYSSVPDKRYNDRDVQPAGTTLDGPNDRTRIDETDAFSARMGLYLTIDLGPDRLHEAPLK